MDTSSPGGGPEYAGRGASDLKLLLVLLLLLGAWGAWPRARTVPAGGSAAFADGLIPGVRRAVLDVNSATADELAALPGVGRVLARRIVTGRAEGAQRYRSSADLDRVPGVGPSARARVAPYVVFLDGDP